VRSWQIKEYGILAWLWIILYLFKISVWSLIRKYPSSRIYFFDKLLRCNNITDQGVVNLQRCFKRQKNFQITLLQNCENVTFSFSGFPFQVETSLLTNSLRSCEQITGAGIDKLGQTLKSLTSLKSLHLDFSWYITKFLLLKSSIGVNN